MKMWVKGDGSWRADELVVCESCEWDQRERSGERASNDGVPSGVPAAANATVCGGAGAAEIKAPAPLLCA